MDPLTPIPTPPAQRWREFRIQTLPIVTFMALIAGVVLLWREYVSPANIIGEVEATRVNLISSVPGTIKELKVKRFDRVKKGEEIAIISVMTPELYESSLRSIEAQFKMLAAQMRIALDRETHEFESRKLAYELSRVELDVEKVNSRIYAMQLARQEALLTNAPGLYAAAQGDYWRQLAETAAVNVSQREKIVSDQGKLLPSLAPSVQQSTIEDIIAEQIKAQEEKLRATEQMISLKAPIDGMISLVDHYEGEKIVQNMPIVTISAVQSARIVGYVRKPYSEMPKAGDSVTIRRQTFKREMAQGVVTEVSVQLEPISPTLIPLASGVKVELGLPFAVSLPAELALMPGEAVDLIIKKK